METKDESEDELRGRITSTEVLRMTDESGDSKISDSQKDSSPAPLFH